MIYKTLISTAELAAHLDDPEWAIFDCRFSLDNPERGGEDYRAAHIPGTIYAHLDEDLSGPVIPGRTGRHPLPAPEVAAERFASWGIGPGVQVVVYDDAGGALAAARLWWMLRWLGHEAAAVLDGGWSRWIAEGRPTRSGVETRPAREFIPAPRPELLVTVDEVDRLRQDPAYRLFDVRAAERYRGENETIDPVAGHIPGAISAPYTENLTRGGLFRSPAELRQHYRRLLGETPAGRSVFYCGSGVTSTHSLLALLHAGLGEARLYAGSWSEWIADPERPVARVQVDPGAQSLKS